MKLTRLMFLCAFTTTALFFSCKKEAALTSQEVQKPSVQAASASGSNVVASLARLPQGERSGPYRIVNEMSGRVLEVEQSEINNNGGKVQQWSYRNTDNQKWILTAIGNGAFMITNVGSGKVLEAQAHTANQNGGRVQQWQWLEYNNQQWRFSGSAIINAATGKVLDLSSTTIYVDGGIIQVWNWVNGPNQRWSLQNI